MKTQQTEISSPQTAAKGIVWDNTMGVHGANGGVIVSTVRPDGIAWAADDFQLDADAAVTSVNWQGGYFQTELAQGDYDYCWDWRVIFWEDFGDGTKPGNEIYNFTIANASIAREYWYTYIRPESPYTHYYVMNYSADLPEAVTFNANTKYWITIQGIGPYPPQGCWVRHNDTDGGVIMHEAVLKGVLWGYTDWTQLSLIPGVVVPHDLNFQLVGEGDFIPPVTTCTLDGDFDGTNYTSSVTVTLTATDSESGVNYTKYKVDAGEWQTYAGPFTVAAEGAHTIAFYSGDNAGNTETEKSTTFTIHYLMEITLKGGIGLTVTAKNLGTSPLTVDWTIAFDGGIILSGRNASGTKEIAASASAKIKAMPIGFGKVNIAVDVGGMKKTATGTVLLIFVIGVK